jgi:hypothetical protein
MYMKEGEKVGPWGFRNPYFSGNPVRTTRDWNIAVGAFVVTGAVGLAMASVGGKIERRRLEKRGYFTTKSS